MGLDIKEVVDFEDSDSTILANVEDMVDGDVFESSQLLRTSEGHGKKGNP